MTEYRYFQVEGDGKDDYYNLEGKSCSMPDCAHAAHGAWEWAPGHRGGYRCACCMRAIWQETLQSVQEGLAGLPEGCGA